MNLKNLSMGISRILTTITGEVFIRIPIEYDGSKEPPADVVVSKATAYVYISVN